MSKFDIMQVCWECGGTGKISPPVPAGTLDANWPASITCPVCNGTGEASKKWIKLTKLETKINKILSNIDDILAKLSE